MDGHSATGNASGCNSIALTQDNPNDIQSRLEQFMSNCEIIRPEFSLCLPGRTWEDHSTKESYDFRLGNTEQLVLIVHTAREVLSPAKLQAAVIELYKIRLNALQEHSGKLCTFQSPIAKESHARFDVSVFGRDSRGVLIQVAFLGTPEKIIVLSYYNYTADRSEEEFKRRANEIIATIQLHAPQA